MEPELIAKHKEINIELFVQQIEMNFAHPKIMKIAVQKRL